MSIQEALTTENLPLLEPNLPYIVAMLENASLSINLAISSVENSSESITVQSTSDSDKDTCITDFKQTFSVAPGQKHERQL